MQDIRIYDELQTVFSIFNSIGFHFQVPSKHRDSIQLRQNDLNP